MRKLTITTALAGLALLTVSAVAQTAPTVYATGLLGPSKVVLGPNGSLLVTETGTTPNTGRVSIIQPGGRRQTLIDGLPSGNDDGPNGVAWSGRTIYIANAEGDAFVPGPTPGTQVPNPAGISSPLFATVIRLTLEDDAERLNAGFTLQAADHMKLLDGNPVRLDNGSGGKAVVELLSLFRFGVPDRQLIWRQSHPYGLTMLRNQPRTLFMADAGMNSVVAINAETGRTRTLARLPLIPNPTPSGPPMIEPVTTSVQPYGDHLLVSYLSGAPFVPGVSGVMELDPETGRLTPFIAYLTSAIDVMFRLRENGDGQFLALEYSAALTRGAPGRLRSWVNGEARVLSETLPAPSSMVFDRMSGSLYITSRSEGTVLRLELGR